tara:strand:- start:5393 stop:7021 length:1629 start_codon:yes stop_codon:yes gene_type:complete
LERFRKFYEDVLYVSKITKTGNKKITIFIAVVLSQLTAATDIGIIIFFAAILTGSFDESNIFAPVTELVLDYKFILPIMVVLRFVFIYVQSMSLKNLELNVQRNLKVFLLDDVFDKRNYSIADAYFYINVLAGHISFFYSNLTGFINSSLQTVAYLTYLVIADSRVIFTFGLGALALSIPTRILIRKARQFMHESYEYTQQSNVEVQRIVDNMLLIKILKKETEEINNFSMTLKKLNESVYNNHKYGAFNSFLPSFVTMFVFSILLGISQIAKSITLDFIGVTLRLFQSLGGITNATNQIINSHVHIEKFYEMEKNKGIIYKDNFRTDNLKNGKAIEVKDASFKYFSSETLIFENLNLSFEKNSHTLLTGPNGSGKSTLLGLISGVFYAEKGSITTSTERYGYIGATPLIFTATLRENLLYGNNFEIDDKTLVNYLKEFDTFKEESNYDLNRVIDNKSLSSGQMQKIAFIRALVAKVEILLLDESTANLDDKTRNLIFNILENTDITIINSTHDPESFKNIDSHYRIELVDEKRVINAISLN